MPVPPHRRWTPSHRLCLATIVAAALTLAAPSAAAAATIAFGATVSYTGEAGEFNSPEFFFNSITSPEGDPITAVTVFDSADNWGTYSGGIGCSQTLEYFNGAPTGRMKTTCGVENGVTKLLVNTGDLPDGVSLSRSGANSVLVPSEMHLGAGQDATAGSDLQDLINGDGDDDTIYVGEGGDVLSGGDGAGDVVILPDGDGGRIELGAGGNGHAGWDATVQGDFERLHGGNGDDTLIGDGDGEWFEAGAGTDTVIGNGGDDWLWMADGGGSASGGPGDDLIFSETWPMTVDGGTENAGGGDWVLLNPPTPPDGGPTPGLTLELGTANLTDVENIRGGSGNDVIKGDGQANEIEAGSGDDKVNGGAGSDELLGQDGQDQINSSDGAYDFVNCGPDVDNVASDAGVDTVQECETSGVAITSGPTGTTGSSDATFQFNLPSAPQGKYQCQLDGGGFFDCTSPMQYAGLSEGEHTFEVRFVPEGATAGEPTERKWKIDLSVPYVIIDSAPSGSGHGPEADVVFRSSEPDGATFGCSLDGQAEYDCSSPQRLLALTAGSHNFAITTTDTVGHKSAAVTVSWEVGGNAPGSTPTPSPSANPTPHGGQTPGTPGGCASPLLASVSFGPVVAVVKPEDRPAACFSKQVIGGRKVNVSTGRVFVNGIAVVPDAGTKLIVDSAVLNGVVKTTGPSSLFLGSVELPMPEPFEWTALDNTNIATGGKVLSIWEKFLGPKAKSKPPFPFRYLNLPVVATPTIELSKNNGGEAKLGVKVGLPSLIFASLPGPQRPLECCGRYGPHEHEQSKGVSFDVSVSASNDYGVKYTSKAKISEVWLFGRMKVKDIELAVDSAGYYDGAASFMIGDALFGRAELIKASEYRVAIQLGPNGFIGPLRKFAFQRSNINRPITPFIFLQRLGGEIGRTVSPLPPGLGLSAVAGLSAGPDLSPLTAGPAVGVDGTVQFFLPDEYATPWFVQAQGTAKLVDLATAGLGVKYEPGKRLAISGSLDASVGGWGINGAIDQSASWVSGSGFNIAASGDINAFGERKTGEGVVSDKGFVVCSGAAPKRVGLGRLWGAQLTLFGNACDLGPFSSTANAAQVGASYAVEISTATELKAFEIEGVDDPPAITVTGPSGFSLSQHGEVFSDADGRRTYLVLRDPPPGRYTIASLDASSTVRTADGLPAPKVKAWVRGTGTTRTLRWRAAVIDGQQLRFVEQGPAGPRILLTTRRHAGTKSFRPAPSTNYGPRSIEAHVLQYGLPRSRMVVARYRLAAQRLRAVQGLRLRRNRLTWRRQPVAAQYAVLLENAKRTRTSMSVRGNSLTLPRRFRRGRLSVTVVAVDAAARPGPRVTRTLRRRGR